MAYKRKSLVDILFADDSQKSERRSRKETAQGIRLLMKNISIHSYPKLAEIARENGFSGLAWKIDTQFKDRIQEYED